MSYDLLDIPAEDVKRIAALARTRIVELEAALRECASPIRLQTCTSLDFEELVREANRRQTLAARAIGKTCAADVKIETE